MGKTVVFGSVTQLKSNSRDLFLEMMRGEHLISGKMKSLRKKRKRKRVKMMMRWLISLLTKKMFMSLGPLLSGKR
jgi:predicted nucleic acid-binding Zn ribbon protein